MVDVPTSDLVIQQWQNSPKLRALIDAAGEDIRTELAAIQTILAFLTIDGAVGEWLDRIGIRLGLQRPSTTDSGVDMRFGFDGVERATGWDQHPFAGAASNDATFPLPDSLYRRLIKARAVLVLSNGTINDFTRAIKKIDAGATVQDRRNMTIRIVTQNRPLIELADTIGALPRAAGVLLDFGDRGRFGFDDAGEPFDQGPFR